MFVLVHVNGYPIPEHDQRDDGQYMISVDAVGARPPS